MEAEAAAGRQDTRTLYRITSKLKGGDRNPEPPVKDSEGKTINSEADKIKRWKEHFESILNRKNQDTEQR